MTKKQKGALIFLGICFLGAALALRQVLPKKDVLISVGDEQPQQAVVSSTESAAVDAAVTPEKYEENKIAAQLKKCFPQADTGDITWNQIERFFEKRATLSAPALEDERYELTTKAGQELVVQYIPAEEIKNQVRVFAINKTDGLPDRIQKFPGSTSSEITKRLQGALSLGEISQKSETTQQAGPNGESLQIEKNKETTTKIRYTEPGLEFLCEDGTCQCNQFK